MKDQRDYVFWLGSLAGLSAAAWLIPAGLTFQAGSAERAELGGWIVVLGAAFFYGGIPRYLLPRTPSERD